MTSPTHDNHDPADAVETVPVHGAYDRRDGDALRIMGVFFAVLATAVFLATQWDQWNQPEGALNIAAAIALLLVGLGLFLAGRILQRRPDPRDRSGSP